MLKKLGKGVVGLLVLALPPGGLIVTVYLLSGHHADVSYFETVAQIIPILIVALAIEVRYLTPREEIAKMVAGFYGGQLRVGKGLTILYTFMTFGLVVLGEAVALQAIASQDPNSSNLQVTTGGLVAGMIALITAIVIPAQDETKKPVSSAAAEAVGKTPQAAASDPPRSS